MATIEYVPAVLELGTGTGAGNLDLGGVTQRALTQATDLISDATSGEPYPRFQAVRGQTQNGSFGTKAIADALGLIGVLGYNIASLTGGCNLYAKPKTLGGTRGTTGRKCNILKGMVVPGVIDVSHPGDAVLSGRIIVAHDGSANHPVIMTDSASIPANSDDERFGIGPWDVAGITLANITAISIDFGLTVGLVSADGDVWGTFYSIDAINPVIRITTKDVTHIKDAGIPMTGVAGTHAGTGNGTVGYLKKRAAGGTFVANGTAEHIKFTMDGYAVAENVLDAGGPNDPDEVTIVVTGRFDGTNNPLVVDTASAIT